jgi:hypothetical protein
LLQTQNQRKNTVIINSGYVLFSTKMETENVASPRRTDTNAFSSSFWLGFGAHHLPSQHT